jgi:uncharacterized protein YndB with AHSA1/START domain
MAAKTSFPTTLTMPSDRELVITRTFDAPRRLVFEALTKCEHVARWYGPRRFTLASCEMDIRPGGRWRFVVRDADGSEFGFAGEYREIVPPERIVSTEGFEGMPGHEYVATLVLDEHDGQTTLTNTLVYQSAADRDGHLHSGMEPGLRETYDRLAELLATMA